MSSKKMCSGAEAMKSISPQKMKASRVKAMISAMKGSKKK